MKQNKNPENYIKIEAVHSNTTDYKYINEFCNIPINYM